MNDEADGLFARITAAPEPGSLVQVWNALRSHSPASPRFTPKLNLGNAFRVHVMHVVHVTRHAEQVERLATQV